jgi:hypothetical protein
MSVTRGSAELARVAVTATGRFQVYDAKETAVFVAASALTAGTWTGSS